MSTVMLQSGTWTGTGEQFRATYIKCLELGSLYGVENTLSYLMPEYAKDTGDFRASIRVSILQEIKFEAAKHTTEFKLSINKIVDAIINLVFYAQYHIDGKPNRPGDLSPYWYPTTEGTRPLDTAELRSELVKNIRKAVRLQILSVGFDLSIFGGSL